MWFVNIALARSAREGVMPWLNISPGCGMRPPIGQDDTPNLLTWVMLAPAAREVRRLAGIEGLQDE